MVCGPSGLPVSRRVRRRAGAARSRGDSPVRREVIWPTILPYMFGLFESSQDVPGEAGRPSGREFQSPGVGSRPGGRHARPAGGGYWGVTPLENSSRSAGGSECMQEMAPRCGIIKGTDSPLDSLTFSTLRGRRPPSSDALTGRPLRDAHPPTTHHENSLGVCGRSLVLGKHPRATAPDAAARARLRT